MPQQDRTTFRLQQLEDRTTPAIGFGPTNPGVEFAPDRVLVGFHPGQEQAALAGLRDTPQVAGTNPLGFGIHLITLTGGLTVPAAVQLLSGRAGVKYVEPDYKGYRTALPNDQLVQDGSQWGVNNYGQNGGVAGADIKAATAWGQAVGTGQTVVAVLDDGVDFTHPDLAANMWRNPGEIPGNNVDDDGNGYVDDVHGANVVLGTGDPMPGGTDAHGTHVAGTIGAVGNNGVGVSGVAQRTRIMAVNIFQTGGGYFVSDEIRGVAYAVANGAKVMNGSIGGTYGLLQSELAAYRGARDAGVIAVLAAGNSSANLDSNIHYPAGLTRYLDNVVTVAATDRSDNMSGFSNYSATVATIGAPGSAIISTVRNGQYQNFNGTSMASPHVAGAVTVFWDANPDFSYQEVIQALKDSARRIPAMDDRVSTDGVLDLDKFLSLGKVPLFATGADAGGGPHVKVYRGNGRQVGSFMAYSPAFTGGVRVATGDVTGDGFPDVVTAAGPGGGPHVKVFDGRTFREVFSFFAFEPTFTGGLTVATGDVNGDGRADVIVGADRGGGPRVAVFSRAAATGPLVRIADFFAYDAGFRGGVRVSAGVFTAGGKQADVVTTPGQGGGPHLKRFAAASLTAGRPAVAAQTMVGDPASRGGLWVSTGDVNGDGVSDVSTGVGAGTPTVTVLDGRSLGVLASVRNPFTGEAPSLTNPFSPTQVGGPNPPAANNGLLAPGTTPDALPFLGSVFTPGASAGYMFGVRVAMHDVDGDKKPDLILAGGPNDAPVIALISGQTFATIGTYYAYDPSFIGGVFVGA